MAKYKLANTNIAALPQLSSLNDYSRMQRGYGPEQSTYQPLPNPITAADLADLAGLTGAQTNTSDILRTLQQQAAQGVASGARPQMPNYSTAELQRLAQLFGNQLNAPLSGIEQQVQGYDPNSYLTQVMNQIGRSDTTAPLRNTQSNLTGFGQSVANEKINTDLLKSMGELKGEAGRVKSLNLANDINAAIKQIRNQIPGVQGLEVVKPLMDLSNEIAAAARDYKGKDYSKPLRDAISSIQSSTSGPNSELMNELLRQRAAYGTTAKADYGFGEEWAQRATANIGRQIRAAGAQAMQSLNARLSGSGLTGGVASNAQKVLAGEIAKQTGMATRQAVLEGESGRQQGIIAQQNALNNLLGLSSNTAQALSKDQQDRASLLGALSGQLANIDLGQLQGVASLYGQAGNLATQAQQNQLAKAGMIADLNKSIGGLASNKGQLALGQAQLVGDLLGRAGGLAQNAAANRLNQLQLAGNAFNAAGNAAQAETSALANRDKLMADVAAQMQANAGGKLDALGNLATRQSANLGMGYGLAASDLDRLLKGYDTEAKNYSSAIGGMSLFGNPSQPQTPASLTPAAAQPFSFNAKAGTSGNLSQAPTNPYQGVMVGSNILNPMNNNPFQAAAQAAGNMSSGYAQQVIPGLVNAGQRISPEQMSLPGPNKDWYKFVNQYAVQPLTSVGNAIGSGANSFARLIRGGR